MFNNNNKLQFSISGDKKGSNIVISFESDETNINFLYVLGIIKSFF